jgi:hypothetical protein
MDSPSGQSYCSENIACPNQPQYDFAAIGTDLSELHDARDEQQDMTSGLLLHE